MQSVAFIPGLQSRMARIIFQNKENKDIVNVSTNSSSSKLGFFHMDPYIILVLLDKKTILIIFESSLVKKRNM